ncbi:hypothetical protein [uncultured Clostridium sp.]|uniref:hypothetical protein n=1 Tax=uncultured Clostridium sp. TaxID=59620 RepID=UPI00260F7EE5|nr:hypothetical protein [uncultured Clostridium sp.]
MEDVIKKFLTIKPTGSGSGSGSGSGDGDGYGYGDGSGYGSGYGSGSGDGDGYGYGDGDGSGYGSGYGSGDGSGYGDGSGSGSGYGSGYGYGDGGIVKINPKYEQYKKGFLYKKIASFMTFNKKPVYYVDNIPCVFLSIVNNVAKVLVIQYDFSIQKSYIAKSNNLFAHGDTKEEAIQSVNDKYFASLSFDEKKNEFIKLFKKDEKYANKLFFDWHHSLTGSCETGRRMFVQSHGIDLSAEMTTLDFLKLTQNEYKGEMIRQILAGY